MSPVSAHFSTPEPTEPAARWIELAERVSLCGRNFRDQLGRQAAGCGLSGGEFSLLWVCRQATEDGLAQKQLAAALAISPAQVSGLVEGLRRRRLLEGRRSGNDRRCQLWRLTPAGRAKLGEVARRMIDWAGRLEDRLGAESAHKLVAALGRIASVLDGGGPSGGAALRPFRPADRCRSPRRKGVA